MRGGPNCDICAYAREHGSWPPDHVGTHCGFDGGCHRSWRSLAQSHCLQCHRHFGSNAAGDAHRLRDECRDPKGFDVWPTDAGPIFGGRDPVAAAERARAARKGQSQRPEATPDDRVGAE